MMQGWIKLHRELVDSKLWSCSDATFKVAVYLLLSANHSRKYHRRITIERGQCVRSLTIISEDCNLSRKAVRHALKILAKDNFLSLDEPFGAQQGHRITIINYNTYQGENYDRGIEGSNEGYHEGANEGSTNNNENNKSEQEENILSTTVDDTQGGLDGLGNDMSIVGDGGKSCDSYENELGCHGSHKGIKGTAGDSLEVPGRSPSGDCQVLGENPGAGSQSTEQPRGGGVDGLDRSRKINEGPDVKSKFDTESCIEFTRGCGQHARCNEGPGTFSDEYERGGRVDVRPDNRINKGAAEKSGDREQTPQAECGGPSVGHGKAKEGDSKSEKPKKPKLKLDLSGVNKDLLPTIEEFVEYRRIDKKKPLTQRALNGALSGFSKSAEICNIPVQWVVEYAMMREWLVARPEWVKKSIEDIRLQFVDNTKTRKTKQHTIDCRCCFGYEGCMYSDDNGRSECSLYSPKNGISQNILPFKSKASRTPRQAYMDDLAAGFDAIDKEESRGS